MNVCAREPQNLDGPVSYFTSFLSSPLPIPQILFSLGSYQTQTVVCLCVCVCGWTNRRVCIASLVWLLGFIIDSSVKSWELESHSAKKIKSAQLKPELACAPWGTINKWNGVQSLSGLILVQIHPHINRRRPLPPPTAPYFFCFSANPAHSCLLMCVIPPRVIWG